MLTSKHMQGAMAKSAATPPCEITWSLGSRTIAEACPLCSSREALPIGGRRDDALLFPDTWHFAECRDCKSIYLIDRPDDASLHQAYDSYYTHEREPDALAREHGVALAGRLINGYLNRRYRMRRKSALSIGHILFMLIPPLRMGVDVYARHVPERLLKPTTRLLDYGCGNGDFLLRALEMGIQPQGCDPDPKAVAQCRKAGLEVELGSDLAELYPPGTFHYVTLSHVIEHSTNIRKTLTQVYSVLKPGGAVWIALPNPRSLDRRALGLAWTGLHPPYHLAIPSHASLRRVLEESGFRDIRLLTRGMESTGMYRYALATANNHDLEVDRLKARILRAATQILATMTYRWSNETIAIASKPG